MRYKGQYIAQVIINFDIDANQPNLKPFDAMRQGIVEQFTPELKHLIEDAALDENATCEVNQLYADLYKVTEE